jgi:hypothetical protein
MSISDAVWQAPGFFLLLLMILRLSETVSSRS